jgi:peptidoglycan/LPS O-acetylase OafA/YrhL
MHRIGGDDKRDGGHWYGGKQRGLGEVVRQIRGAMDCAALSCSELTTCMHFKNLNSVRAIAASMVIVHHIEQAKNIRGLVNYISNPTVLLAGKLGVIIFFALSGFLITSLLIEEQRKTGRIAIKNFYLRRVFRIWPLYFLIVGLSLFMWPHVADMQLPDWAEPNKQLGLNAALLALMLPNLQLYLIGPISFSAHVWSIGVEEQFYLFWPFIIILAKRLQLRTLVLMLLTAFIFIKILPYVLPSTMPGVGHLTKLVDFMANYWQVDCMMWGGLFAAFFATGTGRAMLTTRRVQVISYLLFIGLSAAGVHLGTGVGLALYWDMYAALASLLIYNLVQPTSIVNLEYTWLSQLGLWSYGMYMLHMLIVWPLTRFVGDNNLVLYPLVFTLTIGLAYLSYQYFEKPFLRIKKRFEAIPANP